MSATFFYYRHLISDFINRYINIVYFYFKYNQISKIKVGVLSGAHVHAFFIGKCISKRYKDDLIVATVLSQVYDSISKTCYFSQRPDIHMWIETINDRIFLHIVFRDKVTNNRYEVGIQHFESFDLATESTSAISELLLDEEDKGYWLPISKLNLITEHQKNFLLSQTGPDAASLVNVLNAFEIETDQSHDYCVPYVISIDGDNEVNKSVGEFISVIVKCRVWK